MRIIDKGSFDVIIAGAEYRVLREDAIIHDQWK